MLHSDELHPSFFRSSSASLWTCRTHTEMNPLGGRSGAAHKKPNGDCVHLFVLRRVGGVVFGFGQPEQRVLIVFHGHVGLPQHQQVFAVEVWINWEEFKTSSSPENPSGSEQEMKLNGVGGGGSYLLQLSEKTPKPERTGQRLLQVGIYSELNSINQ